MYTAVYTRCTQVLALYKPVVGKGRIRPENNHQNVMFFLPTMSILILYATIIYGFRYLYASLLSPKKNMEEIS